MPERTTTTLESVLSRGEAHARRLRRNAVRPEHLVLAITDAPDSTAGMVLAALDVPAAALRGWADSRARTGRSAVDARRPLSAEVQAALERARHEADGLAHPRVGTDHLLLGLVTGSDEVAEHLREGFGITAERLRDVVRHLFDADPRARESGVEPSAQGVLGARRLALPAALRSVEADIAEATWQKEMAVDDEEYQAAADWREEQKRLEAARRALLATWAAGTDGLALAEELVRLYRQADRLRDLLHRHGVTVAAPDAEPGSRDRRRRPAPNADADAVASAAGSEASVAAWRAQYGPWPDPDLVPVDEPDLPGEERVNVRGWLEGKPELIQLAREYVAARVGDDWRNFGWAFPASGQAGYRYALFGQISSPDAVEWFRGELDDLAVLAPAGAGDQLAGYFLVTGSDGETLFRIRDRQVHVGEGG